MDENDMRRNFKIIFKFIWEYDKLYILFSIISIIVDGLIPALLLLIMQKIINAIQTQDGFNTILQFVIIYILLDLLKDIYSNFINYYNSKFEKNFELHMSTKLFNKAEKLKLSDYENSNTYNVINRAQNEGGNRVITFYTSIVKIISSIIMLMTYAAILLSFRYWIIGVIILIPICKFVIETRYNKKAYNIIYARTNEERKTWYINYLLTYGSFYKEIKILGLFGFFINKYRILVKHFNSQDLNLLKEKSFKSVLISIMEGIVDGFLFIYIILLGIHGEILIGSLLTYLNVIISCKNSITSILMNVSQSIRESLFIKQLFEFFNMQEEKNEGKITIEKIEEIEFIDVSYKYQNTDRYVLKNIKFKISGNEKIALIGINGSGKSTLIKLMMGFYDNYEGTILVNKIDLERIDKLSLQRRISTLFQDYIRFESTFRENISYGDISLVDDSNKILSIINKFKFGDMLKAFPNGLDTQLGNWFDEGINISNGQWQKVALARAFAKNADIYFLDEPNAAMDVITENEVLCTCKEQLANKMAVIITHKFSDIITTVDDIIVLDKGEIKERGEHIELLNSNGLYYELFNKYKHSNLEKI